jgi:hypothetical protein
MTLGRNRKVPHRTPTNYGMYASGKTKEEYDEAWREPKPPAPSQDALAEALRRLLDAVETMDQKITPYGEREDGTILHYLVADSTWHRILAAARHPELLAALASSGSAGETE